VGGVRQYNVTSRRKKADSSEKQLLSQRKKGKKTVKVGRHRTRRGVAPPPMGTKYRNRRGGRPIGRENMKERSTGGACPH